MEEASKIMAPTTRSRSKSLSAPPPPTPTRLSYHPPPELGAVSEEASPRSSNLSSVPGSPTVPLVSEPGASDNTLPGKRQMSATCPSATNHTTDTNAPSLLGISSVLEGLPAGKRHVRNTLFDH
jgi:hypothetical protein